MQVSDISGELPRVPENLPAPLEQVKDKWTLHWPALAVDPGTTDAQAQAMLENIAREHIARDWGGGQRGGGIMYHWAIAPSGRVFKLRPSEFEWTWATNVDGPGGGNRSSIQVLMLYGANAAPTAAALQALEELLITHPLFTVYGHRDWVPDACPGDALYEYAQSKTTDTGRWIFTPVSPPSPPPPAPAPAVVPVLGASQAGTRELARALFRHNPAASIAVPRLYADLAPLAGIRAEVAFAQAMKETKWLTYPRLARPEWHNFAGLGCDERSGICNVFTDDEAGVRAHLGHLLCYFGDHVPAFCSFDQRHDLVGHRHYANDVAALSTHWAPAADYHLQVVAFTEELLIS